MSKLGQVVESVENYNKFFLDQVKRARSDQKFGRDLLGRWNDTKAKIPFTRTPKSSSASNKTSKPSSWWTPWRNGTVTLAWTGCLS